MSTLPAMGSLEAGARDWFTSDTHFGHTNIIRFCNRPFANVSAMNNGLIEMWNSQVGPNDRVIHLGDLYWGSDRSAWLAVRRRLNGHLALVPGNHDPVDDLLACGAVDELLPPICEVFYTCKRTKSKRYFVLCHYPMAEWQRAQSGAIHLHGHTHGNAPLGHPTPKGLRRLDVGVDPMNFLPQSPQSIMDRFPA